MMLEELPAETIPMAESNKLQQLHRISQQSMMLGWPRDRLQPEISTPGCNVGIRAIAEFETLRLGFLITIKETLLGVYDRLTNQHGTATATQLPQLAHFLDMKPALTWIQFILPEDLTHSPLQLATLQDTFGPLGEIAEIFLFEPRPEGFIIFHDSLHIPNFDEILAPQHSLVRIKNPKHSSPPIRSTAAPHYPTRRTAIGTLVTLSLRGSDQHEATVVAIEQSYWPREWIHILRIEESGKSPEFLFTILDRANFNLEDISTRICPKAVLLAERDVALIFDKFERPIQVTIIQQNSPGFYQTVRMVQPLLAKLSPRMIVRDNADHRLFTANMLPSGMAQLSDETQPGQTSKSETNCGPDLTWTGPPVATITTTTNQDRPPEPLAALSNTSQTEADHGEALELERRQTTKGEERTTLNVEESGHPKEAAVSRGIATENPDKMAQLYLPMHLLGSAYPSHAD